MQSSAVCTFQTLSCYNLNDGLCVNVHFWPNFLVLTENPWHVWARKKVEWQVWGDDTVRMVRPRMMKTRGSVTGGREEVGEEKVAGVKQRAAREPREAGGGEWGLGGIHVVHALSFVKQGVDTEGCVGGGVLQQSVSIGFVQHLRGNNCFIINASLCPPLLTVTGELELKLPPEMTPPFLPGPRLLLVLCRQLSPSHWSPHYGLSVPGSGDGGVMSGGRGRQFSEVWVCNLSYNQDKITRFIIPNAPFKHLLPTSGINAIKCKDKTRGKTESKELFPFLGAHHIQVKSWWEVESYTRFGLLLYCCI